MILYVAAFQRLRKDLEQNTSSGRAGWWWASGSGVVGAPLILVVEGPATGNTLQHSQRKSVRNIQEAVMRVQLAAEEKVSLRTL